MWKEFQGLLFLLRISVCLFPQIEQIVNWGSMPYSLDRGHTTLYKCKTKEVVQV